MPYVGPRPPVGIHRYVLVVYQQKARVTAPPSLAPATEATRARFSNRAFADRHDLGLPVAAMFFNAQKETASRRRHYWDRLIVVQRQLRTQQKLKPAAAVTHLIEKKTIFLVAVLAKY